MTTIEWTQNPDGTPGKTWNPVRGCQEISPGCARCYAKTFAERWRGVPGHPYEQGFDVRLVPEKLREPFTWRKPQRVFVNSMSDLWHEDVPNEYIAAVYGVMAAAYQHTYMALTKRAERLPEWYRWAAELVRPNAEGSKTTAASALLPYVAAHGGPIFHEGYRHVHQHGVWPLPNVWVGVSVENRKHGLPRIELLRQVPAAVRFLSIEPMLEDLGELDLRGIHWVIVGGESGPGARVCDVSWIESIIEQCKAAGVPAFCKQLGAKPVTGVSGNFRTHKGKRQLQFLRYPTTDRKGADLGDFPESLRVREFPEVAHA